MEFESTEKLAMVYETLKNIETAITRLAHILKRNYSVIIKARITL